MSAQIIGFITGLTAEARIAARCGGLLRAGGGTPAGAERAARQLVAEGAGALVSFGLAGGLDPALRPGALVVPARITLPDESMATALAMVSPNWLSPSRVV